VILMFVAETTYLLGASNSDQKQGYVFLRKRGDSLNTAQVSNLVAFVVLFKWNSLLF
jgi:hypothetical protein